MTPPSPAMLRAYRLSHYAAGGLVAHVGCYPQGMEPAPARVTLVMLGACNPGGRRRPDGSNARMMDGLRQALRRFHFVEATGSLNRWSEAMLLVPMDPCRAAVVARRFRQNAIIVISRTRRTRLVVLAEKIPNISG